MKILEWGIYLVIFFLPLYLVRLTIFNIPTNIIELMIGVLFIIWLIIKTANSKQRTKNKEFKKLFVVLPRRQAGHYSLFIAIILILIGVSLSTAISWDLRMSAGIWKSWFVVPLLFFVILITTIKKPKQIEKIFWAFILSGFIVSVISLVYLIQGNLDGMSRLQGFYNSPNYLAMYLAPALVLSLGLLFKEKKRILKILYLVSCFLFLVTLFFTKSLGAWLGVIVAVCFGFGLYLWNLPAGRQGQDKKKLIWAIIVLGLIIIFVLTYLKLNSDDGRKSFNARLIIWQEALKVFKNYPITGIGPGTFQDYFPSYPIWGVPQPHNLYLAFLIQTGIIGFIGFIWLLIQFFRKGFRVYGLKFTVLLMMVMICILIHGLVDTTYWKNDLSIVFWTIVGLMVVLRKNLNIKSLEFD